MPWDLHAIDNVYDLKIEKIDSNIRATGHTDQEL